MKQLIQSVLLCCIVTSLFGCATYQKQSAQMTEAWQAGNGVLAATDVTAKAEKACGSKDELVWRLEQGAILSSVGDIKGSLNAFNSAEELINRYEEDSKVKVGSEALALVSTQANLPYRGHAYDKIMLNTYKAIDYLCLLDPDNARIELNRALQRQRDAVAENQKELEKAVEAAEEARDETVAGSGEQPGYDVKRAQQDAKFSGEMDTEIAEVDRHILPYADYVNPFSVFMDGLFFSQLAADNADVERARHSFERVLGMSPGKYIAADSAMAEAMASGAPAEKITYVVFATGSAPSRKQIRLDIPLFLVTDEISYVGAAFPRLEYHDNYIPQMCVSANGTSWPSERLCSMDAVISRDFKNEWPMIMTKTLLTTATKAIAGRAAEQALDDNVMGKWAAKAISVTYQAATNIADLRTWTTLPKEFSYIRVPTPEDGELGLQIGMNSQTVHVTPGKTNILMVRSVNSTAQPILEHFTLN